MAFAYQLNSLQVHPEAEAVLVVDVVVDEEVGVEVIAEDEAVDEAALALEAEDGAEGEEQRVEEAVVVVGAAAEEVPEAEPMSFWNHTDTPECLSRKARSTSWLPEISFPASRYMAKSVFLSKGPLARTVQRLRPNTEFGIHLGASWPQAFSEVSTTYILPLAKRFCIS
ncbi:hypothetical protein FRC12_008136, partial [Ceratobasidium sp. 428]